MITWKDFEKIEVRTGTITAVANFPDAKKPAYQLTIDFGESGIKKSSAQITQLYTREVLIGKQVVAVVNLPTKQIGKFFSECLVMGVYNLQNDVVLLQPSLPVTNGCRIG
ncbi:tRNA-binding protein [Ferruginibacter sp.]|uniref:tRNA-binding protein n=1 Tax=Ferruginibacter sp. TaxID=1940288 RepID=UPI00265A8463|nr:tRNA-binding protein [Ferruginibacter sp.]